MSIHNKVLQLVNDYDYKNEVEEGITDYKKLLINERLNNVISLDFNVSKEYRGIDEEEITKKVANEIIGYKIKEKIFIKLISEGIIYPIGITNGWESHRVQYITQTSSNDTTLEFRRVLFNQFMKV